MTSITGKTAFHLVALALLGFLIYSNSFQNSFHFDDQKVIVANEAIRNLGDLRAIFDAFNTRFLTGLSLAANYAAGRLDVRGYHAFNLTVHILNAFLVYTLARLTFQTRPLGAPPEGMAPLAALSAALLFLSHPVQTQAVNYIWQRAALLAAFFHLAALTSYARMRLKRDNRYFALALGFVILGLFTKETMVLCPASLLLYDVMFLDPCERLARKARRVLPFVALCAVVPLLLITRAEHASLQLMRPHESGDFTRFVTEAIMPRAAYLLTQAPVLVTYLRLLVFPVALNLDYDFPVYRSLTEPAVWVSALLLSALLAAAVFAFRRNRILSFSIFLFFLALSLESLVPQNDVLFEHRLYPAVAGFALCVSSLLFKAEKKKAGAFAAICAVVAAFSCLTFLRNAVWRSEWSLWNDVVSRSPKKARPYNNRGSALMEAGRLDQARADFEKASRLNPGYAEVYVNLGILADRQNHLDEAVAHYSKAILLNPGYAKAYNNRGVDFQLLKEYNQAIVSLSRAVELKPNYSQAYNNRGNCYLLLNKPEAALADYDAALRADPMNADAYLNRGAAHLKLGEPKKALADFRRVLKLRPGDREALRALQTVAGLSNFN